MNALIPTKDSNYVPCENYSGMMTIMKSGKFLPFLITGPTGAGKTKSIDQVHAEIGKPLYRVNITSESDEDSLMGGLRINSGSTYFSAGPVVEAMKNGGTLLLDEIDLGSPNKIMCLQSVLEGVGYLIKKTGEWITPAPGFMVVATANTKMAGDESGQYIATQILNEAFRDRFIITFEHNYASKDQEENILKLFCVNNKISLSESKIKHLVEWAAHTRDNQNEDMQLDACISTRRLISVLQVYSVFNDMEKSLKLALSKYTPDIQESFMEMWRMTDPETDTPVQPTAPQKRTITF